MALKEAPVPEAEMVGGHFERLDLKEGSELVVQVETVFEGGVVVSYCHKETETRIRGALLMPSASSSLPYLSSREDNLANPLSLIHDHPYAMLKEYGKHLAVNIPHVILNNWNLSSKLPGANHVALGTRRQHLLQQMQQARECGNAARFCKWRASERLASAVVQVPVPKSRHWITGSARRAKVAASEKIREDLRYLNKDPVKRRRSRYLHRQTEASCDSFSSDTESLVSESPQAQKICRSRSYPLDRTHQPKLTSSKVVLRGLRIDLPRLNGISREAVVRNRRHNKAMMTPAKENGRVKILPGVDVLTCSHIS